MDEIGMGLDGFGRILKIITDIAERATDPLKFVFGTYKGGKVFNIGGMDFKEGEYYLIQHSFLVNGKKILIPALEDDEVTIKYDLGNTVHELVIATDPIKKDDEVLCYQTGDDEEYVILGKVVI